MMDDADGAAVSQVKGTSEKNILVEDLEVHGDVP
jgi:hypothetical protein